MIAQSKIDCEAARHLPVILKIGFHLGEAVPALTQTASFGVRIEVAEDGIRRGVAAGVDVGCAERKRPVDGGYIVLVLPAPLDVETSLERVVADDLREIVLQVEDSVEIIEVQCSSGQAGGASGNADAGNVRRRIVERWRGEAFACARKIFDEQRIRYDASLFENHIAGKRALQDVDRRGVGNEGPLYSGIGSRDIAVVFD